MINYLFLYLVTFYKPVIFFNIILDNRDLKKKKNLQHIYPILVQPVMPVQQLIVFSLMT